MRHSETSPRPDSYSMIFKKFKHIILGDKPPKIIDKEESSKLIKDYRDSCKKITLNKSGESEESQKIRHQIIWGNWPKIFEKVETISRKKELNDEDCAELLQNLLVYSFELPDKQKPSILNSYTERMAFQRSFSTHLKNSLDRHSIQLLNTDPRTKRINDRFRQIYENLILEEESLNLADIFTKKEVTKEIRLLVDKITGNDKIYAQVIDLYYFENLKIREIVTKLNISTEIIQKLIVFFISQARHKNRVINLKTIYQEQTQNSTLP